MDDLLNEKTEARFVPFIFQYFTLFAQISALLHFHVLTL